MRNAMDGAQGVSSRFFLYEKRQKISKSTHTNYSGTTLRYAASINIYGSQN